MRVVPILLAALTALAQDKNPHTTAADAEAGAKIFRSHCADCHGFKGDGGKGPNLTTGVFFHGDSDAALFKNIIDGIPGTAMPSSFFSADQIWQVVTHVRKLAETGSREKPPGNTANGKAVFAKNGCAGCHLVQGQGGSNGPELSFIGSQRPVRFLQESIEFPNANVEKEYWSAEAVDAAGVSHKGFILNEDTYVVQMLTQGKGLETLDKKNLRKLDVKKTSIMPSYKDKINSNDMTDLVAYLWSLQRQRSAQ